MIAIVHESELKISNTLAFDKDASFELLRIPQWTKSRENQDYESKKMSHDAMKCLLKIKTYKMTFHLVSRHFVSGSSGK